MIKVVDGQSNEKPLVFAVDRDKKDLAFMRAMLMAEGCDVVEVSVEEDLVERAVRQHPDVIILDLDLKDRIALRQCAELRRLSATQDIPIILQTAQHGDVDTIVEGLTSGAFDYMIKPYHLKEFVARVGVMIRISRMLHRDRELAMTDDLTGLFNRRTIFERLREEMDRARRYATSISCIMMDLDHFKRINDTYGHLAGDEVLRAAASIARQNKRVPDVVGRYGGEEFLMLLPETGRTGARIVAERVRESIEDTLVEYDDSRIRITASLGVATAHNDEKLSGDELLQRADNALYEAKNRGRNRTVAA